MESSYFFKFWSAILATVIFYGAVFAESKEMKSAIAKTTIEDKARLLGDLNTGKEGMAGLLLKVQNVNRDGLKNFVNLYNMVKIEGKNFTDLPFKTLNASLTSGVVKWLQDNGLVTTKRGGKQISPLVFQILDIVHDIITAGVELLQGTKDNKFNGRQKTTVNAFVQISPDLALPILANVAINQLIKRNTTENLVIKAIFADEPPSDRIIFDSILIKVLRECREGLGKILLGNDGKILSWDKIIINLKEEIQAVIKASK